MKRFGKAAVTYIGATATGAVAILGPDSPWTLVASSILAVLTAYGMYHTPYHPTPQPPDEGSISSWLDSE